MGVFILRGTSMITKEQLLTLDTFPHIKDISLKLYKDFCVDILFKRRFHYYFTDGTDMIVEFREWGVYHMLSIQHIDYTIPKDDFFHRIDSGLELSDFTINNSIKQRYRKEKRAYYNVCMCLFFVTLWASVLLTGKICSEYEKRKSGLFSATYCEWKRLKFRDSL